MRLSIQIGILFAVICLEAPGQTPDSLKYISLKPADFKQTYLKDENTIMIDVREFFEYKKSRIKDAINIPSSGNIDSASDTINKNMSLYLYCTSGYRAKKVAVRLADKGFVKLYNLEGGIKAWKKDGLLLDRKRLRKGEGEKR